MELKDKVAIVTGASKGIGLAIAKSLLESGVKVAGWSRSVPSGLEEPNFLFFETDVANELSVKAAFENTKSAFGDTGKGLTPGIITK